jgi:hypothetical protein
VDKLKLLLKLRESLEKTRCSVDKAYHPHEYKYPDSIDAEDLEDTRQGILNAFWYLSDSQNHLRELLELLEKDHE